MRIAGGHLFRSGHADIQAAIIEDGRSSDVRQDSLVDVLLPQQLAAASIDRIDVRLSVAEVRRIFGAAVTADRPDDHGGSHLRFRLERPVHAARGRVERIDETVVVADEHTAIDDGRLSVGLGSIGKTESPFKL